MPEGLLTGSSLADQLSMETYSVRQGVLRYRQLARDAVDRGDGASLKPGERILLHWFGPLKDAIRQEKRAISTGASDIGRGVTGDVFKLLDTDRLAVLTIHTVLGGCLNEPGGVPVSRLSYAVGRAVVAEIHYDELEGDGRKQLRRMCRRRAITPTKVNWWAKKQLDNPVWERRLCIHVGARLIWRLVGTASATDYDNFQLAFHHERRREGKRTRGYIRMDDAVFDLISEGHRLREHLRPRHMPMVVQPLAWGDDRHDGGGYVKTRLPLISKPTPAQREAIADADLTQLHECLTAVNATPWRISIFTLEVLRELWNSGGGVAGVPARHDAPIPEKPAAADEDEDALANWKQEAKGVYEGNLQLRGIRTEFLTKLDIATILADRPSIWFPHQLDFRGRCYPIPGSLQHQGDDVCRGLLEFAEHREPGDRGHWWLKVHLAGCCGVDKVSFAARVAWVDEQLDTFAGWVADPLVNTGWMEYKKAWQALAAARALTDPDAAGHLPVQMDGTCNGLQHYAAMGRDSEGAAAVNLIPGDAPADIYGHVAEIVGELVAGDAAQGVELAQATLEHIDRDLVKSNVMTSVYGVTMVGARQQMYDALAEMGYDEKERYQASVYLSKTTMHALKQATPMATQIMAWLRRCAQLVSDQAGVPVSWSTPLGLPVIQPYLNWRTVQIKTILQWVKAQVHDENVPIRKGKQADGFAPNFVHSVDASHMLMTARACYRQGIHFAAVHDSYWSHACDADALANVAREQFVELHRRPLLTDLRRQLHEQHPEIDFPEPPETGDYDVDAVKNAPYFFS